MNHHHKQQQHNQKRAKKEGLVIEKNWQDADSSSKNALLKEYPQFKIMICFVHHNRAYLTKTYFFFFFESYCSCYSISLKKNHYRKTLNTYFPPSQMRVNSLFFSD